MWPTRAEQWRTPAIVATSLLLHGALLGYLASRTFELKDWTLGIISDPFPLGRPIPVWLERRPILRGEAVRARRTPPADLPFGVDQRGRSSPDTAGQSGATDVALPSPLRPHETPSTPTTVSPWTSETPDLGARIARGLRARGPSCIGSASLTAAERAACDAAFGERAARVRPITGTGDRARDARFARQGARRLAHYEAMRAPLMPSDDPPCDKGGPVPACEVEIQVEIFSSTRGWLPNQRNRDE